MYYFGNHISIENTFSLQNNDKHVHKYEGIDFTILPGIRNKIHRNNK